jgi:thiamine biosynthesis lipoprotein
MNQVDFAAMGTDITIIDPDTVNADRARTWFETIESMASRFIPDSELSRLNTDTREQMKVSSQMADLLGLALILRERTGGLVDPDVGGSVIAWGYDRTFAEVTDRAEAPAILSGHRDWMIDGQVVSRDPGLLFDLGGIAKGWAGDEAVHAGMGTVVSAGGDICSSDPGTEVEIIDPWGDVAATVHLGIGGLATSSITRRRWEVVGRTAHHIIDPRTGAPARTPVFSATVSAATASEAEAGAKAVLLHGADGLAWAEQQSWIRAAMVVWRDGNVYATTGWEMAA